MQISRIAMLDAFEINNAPSLDPVRVFLQDFGGAGRIIVECYGQAWSAFFGSIGDKSLRQFLSECDTHYLSGKLASRSDALIVKRHQNGSESYRNRVTDAVIAALKETP